MCVMYSIVNEPVESVKETMFAVVLYVESQDNGKLWPFTLNRDLGKWDVRQEIFMS